MNKAMVIIVSCALLVIPSLAQNVLNLNNCSPVGTWYGGSDVKYQLIITPITGERFAIWGTVVAAIGNLGYPGWSPWAGEMTKTKSGRYVFQEIALYTTAPIFRLRSIRLSWMRCTVGGISPTAIPSSSDFDYYRGISI